MIGVIANGVLFPLNASQEVRITIHLLAVHEKGGRHAILLENVEDLIRVRRRRAVIKGQRDSSLASRSAHQRRSQELRTGNRASVVKQGHDPYQDQDDDKEDSKAHQAIGRVAETIAALLALAFQYFPIPLDSC